MIALLLTITGLETVVLLLKLGIPIIVLILSAIGKFLWDIKTSSKKTEDDFHTFKNDFNIEISSIKTEIKFLNSRITDSYSKADSDLRLITLENKLMKEMQDQFNKLRDIIYTSLNRNRQISKSDKPS
jgi:hypothetical protein